MRKYYSDKKIVCFGEVLWDMLPNGNKIGGAPLNVTYHLHKLGIDAALASRIGVDTLGNGIRDFIIKNCSSGSLLQMDTVHPTSTVKAEIQPNHEVTYNIIEEVAWDFIEYDHLLNELITKADYLVYGSLITRNKISRTALYKVLESKLTKVLDVNLRKPFYSKEILRYLLMKANIVKMNEAELQLISEWFD
ncbi:MAG: PfkB family carbohydrate kinase, partial [Chitinophagaceae bacterium]